MDTVADVPQVLQGLDGDTKLPDYSILHVYSWCVVFFKPKFGQVSYFHPSHLRHPSLCAT